MITKDTSTVWQGYPDAIKAAAVGQPRASWSDCFQELKPELDDIGVPGVSAGKFTMGFF
jgi:hypothetical protein